MDSPNSVQDFHTDSAKSIQSLLVDLVHVVSTWNKSRSLNILRGSWPLCSLPCLLFGIIRGSQPIYLLSSVGVIVGVVLVMVSSLSHHTMFIYVLTCRLCRVWECYCWGCVSHGFSLSLPLWRINCWISASVGRRWTPRGNIQPYWPQDWRPENCFWPKQFPVTSYGVTVFRNIQGELNFFLTFPWA